MKNIQKNKKSWFKGLVVASVFAISVLNLSVDFQRDGKGDIDLGTLSLSTTKSMAQWENGQPGGQPPIWSLSLLPYRESCDVMVFISGNVMMVRGGKTRCDPGGTSCVPESCHY